LRQFGNGQDRVDHSLNGNDTWELPASLFGALNACLQSLPIEREREKEKLNLAFSPQPLEKELLVKKDKLGRVGWTVLERWL
jgi:hypothetical protein